MATGNTVMSTACTGVYTVECAAAIVQKTVQESNLVDYPVAFHSDRCWESLFFFYVYFFFGG